MNRIPINVLEMSKEELVKELARVTEERDLYSDILDSMNEEITREDGNGIVIYANRAYREYYGKYANNVVGEIGLNVIIPEDRHLYDVVHTLTPENPEYNLYCRVYKANGEITWVQCNGMGIFDEDGRLECVQETGRDFTELKYEEEKLKDDLNRLEVSVFNKNAKLLQANMQLTHSNEYLDNILKSISEGIIVLDAEGNFEKTNLSLKPELQKYAEVLHEKILNDLNKDWNSPISRLLFNGTPFDGYEVSLKKSGSYINCFLSGVPLSEKMKGQHKGILVIRSESSVHTLINKISGFQTSFSFNDIITESASMMEMIQYSKKVADSDMNFLIEGETGTGKEMLAQSIHSYSKRKKKPFIAINCGAIPNRLVESEFSGYAEGAFTGGIKGGKPGKFELADGGTIFLDEIGELPLENQASLLRILQERKVMRIGGAQNIPIDVRVIAATNKDLEIEVAEGRFREDLYYRLNAITVKVPPLRKRTEDIRGLIKSFMHEDDEAKLEQMGFTSEVINSLKGYSWPGNVRQLQNFVQKVRFLANIQLQDSGMEFAAEIRKAIKYEVTNLGKATESAEIQSSEENSMIRKEPKRICMSMESFRETYMDGINEKEKKYIVDMLELFDGNISQAARKMGISRGALYRKIKKYKL